MTITFEQAVEILKYKPVKVDKRHLKELQYVENHLEYTKENVRYRFYSSDNVEVKVKDGKITLKEVDGGYYVFSLLKEIAVDTEYIEKHTKKKEETKYKFIFVGYHDDLMRFPYPYGYSSYCKYYGEFEGRIEGTVKEISNKLKEIADSVNRTGSACEAEYYFRDLSNNILDERYIEYLCEYPKRHRSHKFEIDICIYKLF